MFIASNAMLNPDAVWSMASTLTFVPLKLNCQHVPQLAELKPSTAAAPPMLGKVGKDPNVVKPVQLKKYISEHARLTRNVSYDADLL